jgi:AraC-like DNA-binding protein
MILAPLRDPFLRAAVRRAVLPEEDVFCCPVGVQDALAFGYPRLLVFEPEGLPWPLERRVAGNSDVPNLALGDTILRHLRPSGTHPRDRSRSVDDAARRLRALMQEAGARATWVEGFFSDLARITGLNAPPEFRGFARRILEYPLRYPSPREMGRVAELSPGAMKERFRRRGLPSPAVYTRWLRLIAAARVLSDSGMTTLAASFRMGFSSDGNFCRWVQATSGLSPSGLRSGEGRLALLARFSHRCLENRALEKWRSLEGLFLREVA